METLSMDAESSMIDPELKRNQKADLSVSWWTVPKATEEEPLQDFIKESLEQFS